MDRVSVIPSFQEIDNVITQAVEVRTQTVLLSSFSPSAV
jgi:hypothetical protein